MALPDVTKDYALACAIVAKDGRVFYDCGTCGDNGAIDGARPPMWCPACGGHDLTYQRDDEIGD